MTTHLAVVERVFLRAGLYKKLVGQCSIFCAIAIAVRGDPASFPISIKCSLKTYMDNEQIDQL